MRMYDIHMNNDFRNQQHPNRNMPSQNHEPPRSGSLLRNYRQQHQQQEQRFQQPAPPTHTQGPPAYSPLPGEPYSNGRQAQNQQWPAPQSWPTGNNNTKQQVQGWVANTMQMVRRWSGRVAAVPPVDQNPLILYRPNSLPVP